MDIADHTQDERSHTETDYVALRRRRSRLGEALFVLVFIWWTLRSWSPSPEILEDGCPQQG